MKITLYKSSLCPRCHFTRKTLEELTAERDDITIELVDVLVEKLQVGMNEADGVVQLVGHAGQLADQAGLADTRLTVQPEPARLTVEAVPPGRSQASEAIRSARSAQLVRGASSIGKPARPKP